MARRPRLRLLGTGRESKQGALCQRLSDERVDQRQLVIWITPSRAVTCEVGLSGLDAHLDQVARAVLLSSLESASNSADGPDWSVMDAEIANAAAQVASCNTAGALRYLLYLELVAKLDAVLELAATQRWTVNAAVEHLTTTPIRWASRQERVASTEGLLGDAPWKCRKCDDTAVWVVLGGREPLHACDDAAHLAAVLREYASRI